MQQYLSLTGSLVLTAECAIDAEPTPASLEKHARWNPIIKTPINPPFIASALNAPIKN